MPQLKELLVEQLQDLLHAEDAADRSPAQDGGSRPSSEAERGFRKAPGADRRPRRAAEKVFELLGEKAEPKPCKAMMGLIEEGRRPSRKARKKNRWPRISR